MTRLVYQSILPAKKWMLNYVMKKQESETRLYLFILFFDTNLYLSRHLYLCVLLLRQKSIVEKSNAVVGRKIRRRDQTGRAVPVPEANAELQANLDVSTFPCL